jgi:PKD repeat protein
LSYYQLLHLQQLQQLNLLQPKNLNLTLTATHNPKTPLTVKFTDKSTGKPIKWAWYFGDKTKIVKTKNATHTYKKAGKYTVALTVMDAKGQRSIAIKKITVSMKKM